jgi:phospholipid/cholesterol/gamma-HCH transport system substrate-binding protein
MRRIAAGFGLVALSVAAAIAVGAGQDTSGYRVDALFDNASNVIPGQDVKIAGARAGRVVGVELTPDRIARVKMEISGEFAPFRTDADCSVQPQSLIGEKFVQCSPGTPRGRKLVGRQDEAPTVPIARTHAPVDLDLVFATFRLPYAQRLAVILNELGAGLAGRGSDLNDTIRRANPALGEAQRTLSILDRDRARLGALVDESDAIIAQLARRRGRVGDFLDRAAAVTTTTAERSSGLRRTIAGLPPMLTEAKPTLDQLAAFMGTARPIVASLRQASPQLERLVTDLGPLADAARPALDRLGGMSETGRDAVRDARKPVGLLRTFARRALPTGGLVDQLFQSLRTRGVVEGLQTFTYFGSTATSRFDRYSHILPSHLVGVDCGLYATKPTAGCDSTFAGTNAVERATKGSDPEAAGEQPGPAPVTDRPTDAQPPAPAPSAPPSSAPPSSTVPPTSLPQLPPVPNVPLPPVNLPKPGAGSGGDQSAQDLLDYLLGNGK